LAGNITINVSEGNAASIPSEIFQVLPACVTRYTRNNETDARGPARPRGSITASVLVDLTARATFFCKLNNNVDAHEGLSVEVVHSILSVLRVFKFNETETSHDTTVNDTTISIKEFGDIFGSSISREPAKVETPGHCGRGLR
jgi:hypothetical protein